MSAPATWHLRDYQAEDAQKVRDAWQRGVARPAIVHATGLGKSSIIAALAVDEARAGGHVLILAHRGELLTQLRDRCRAYAPDVRVGRVQASTREHSAPIIVATVQTLARLVRDGSPRLRRPSLVVIDEAHHASAMTYERITRWAGCYDDGDATRALGVTATMDRAQRRGLGLGDVWQEVVAERSISWGIESGWLVRLRGRVVVADRLDLDKVKISKTTRDYADADLGEMVAQDAPEVVKAWWAEARLPDGSHRQTAAFVPTVAAAEAYTQAFRDAGIAAELVTGKTPARERGDVYRRTGVYGRLADGRTRVLVSVGVLTEGFDCPVISCILMARPTRLDHLYQQMCGRSTRPMDPADWPRWDGGTFHPKDDALILDVVGASRSVHLRTLVNLIPGAPYQGRPCDVCGQPRPCDCDPDDTGAEDFTREPREDTRRRLRGPADYIDVDLLGDARESGLNWLTTHPTDGYEGIPFLSAGDFYGVLWHDEDGTWSGGWVTARGPHDGEWIVDGVDRWRARAAVEALELPTAYGDYAPLAELAQRADDPWRLARKGPSARQLGYATSLGVSAPETLTAGACSDEIDRLRAGRRLVRDF